jgi:TfoX/Sxy family transcriptional regulator of competence genes
MAYDEKLAARVRRLLSARGDVTERAMFGGLTFMAAGHMCCGVNRDELIVRLSVDAAENALGRLGARPTDFTGRPMAGFVTVRPEGVKGRALNRWVALALAHAESLPPKREKEATG